MPSHDDITLATRLRVAGDLVGSGSSTTSSSVTAATSRSSTREGSEYPSQLHHGAGSFLVRAMSAIMVDTATKSALFPHEAVPRAPH